MEKTENDLKETSGKLVTSEDQIKALEEVTVTLTEQKLTFTTEVDSLKKRLSKAEIDLESKAKDFSEVSKAKEDFETESLGKDR